MKWFEVVGLGLAGLGGWATLLFLTDRFFPYRRISWRRAEKAANDIGISMQVAQFDPTLIVGIGRGGAIMGSMLSGCLGHRPLLVLDRKYMWVGGRRTDDVLFHVAIPAKLAARVLLVAGEAHSGNTMRLYYDYLKRSGAEDVRRAALYVERGCTEQIEFHGLRGTRDLRMPWMFAAQYVRDSRSQAEATPAGHVAGVGVGASLDGGHRTYYVIRHGRSVDNENGDRYSGVRDSVLTDVGGEQARRVGHALQALGVDRVISSPMRRASATARAIEELTGAPIVIDNRLREMDFGNWEGLTPAEVEAQWPEAYSRNREDPVAVPIPGGERASDVLVRLKDLVQELEGSPAYDAAPRVAIVTHKTAARVLLAHLQGLPLEQYRTVRIDNASISKVVVTGDGVRRVMSVNETSHLEE